MIIAEINNVLQISHAKLELDGIVALFGRNERGKSSCATAIAECLVSEQIKPAERNARVRSGGGKSRTVITDTDSDKWIAMDYPSGKPSSKDWSLVATRESVGLVEFRTMKEADLSKLIQDIMKANVTQAEFFKALTPYGFDADELKKIWQHIESKGAAGWTTAHDSWKETGAKYKGRWEQITGKTFEPANGLKWFPAGYESDLEQSSEEALSKTLAEEQENLEMLIKAEGISQDKYDALHETALGLEPHKEELVEAQAEKEALEKGLEALQQQLRSLPTPVAVKDYPKKVCAYCSEENVELPGGKLAKRDAVPTPDKELLEAQARVLTDKRAEIATQRQLLDGNSARIMRCKLQIAEAEKALAEIAAAVVTHKDAPAQIEKQRQRVEAAKTRLNAYKRKVEADTVFKSFERNGYLVKALSPAGLRKQKAAAALHTFNEEYLSNVCTLAEWPQVKIHSDMTITYDGRDLMNLKGSALFRSQVALQVAVAYAQRAQILIIDAVDILDSEGRGQFFEMLQSFDWITLMTCTKDSADECPSLRDAEIGVSYWLENNTATEIKAGDINEQASQERESASTTATA